MKARMTARFVKLRSASAETAPTRSNRTRLPEQHRTFLDDDEDPLEIGTMVD